MQIQHAWLALLEECEPAQRGAITASRLLFSNTHDQLAYLPPELQRRYYELRGQALKTALEDVPYALTLYRDLSSAGRYGAISVHDSVAFAHRYLTCVVPTKRALLILGTLTLEKLRRVRPQVAHASEEQALRTATLSVDTIVRHVISQGAQDVSTAISPDNVVYLRDYLNFNQGEKP